MTENRGNAIAYAGGTTHRPLPRADAQTYRNTHVPKTPRPTGLNWDAIRPPDQPTTTTTVTRRCRGCGNTTPVDELRDGRCGVCADELDARFHAPDDTALGLELGELAAVEPDVAAAAASLDDATNRIINRDDHIKLPTEGKQGQPTTGSSAPGANQTSSTPGRAPGAGPSTHRGKNPEAAQGTRPAAASGPTDDLVLEHCMGLLAETRSHADPLIQQLRSLALSALAALDLAYDPPKSIPSPTTTTSARFEVFERPHRTRRPSLAAPLDAADVVRRYQAGDSAPEIARALKCTPKRIRAVLDAEGVQRRDDRATKSGGGNRRDTYPGELVDAIRTRYIDQQMTQAAVAADLGVGVKTVQNVMAKHNIPSRPAAHARSQTGVGHPIKLDPAAVDEICRRYQAGESSLALATAYDVSPQTILHHLRFRGVPVRRPGRPSTTPTTQENPAHA